MNIKNIYSNKFFLVIEMLILIVFPLVLIYIFPPIIHQRLKVMVAGLTYVYFVSKVNKLSFVDIGFTSNNVYHAVRSIIPITILMLFLQFIAYKISPSLLMTVAVKKEIHLSSALPNILAYIFISSLVQEIVFRTFLIPRLEKVTKNKLFLICFTSIIFGSIHIPLNNLFLTGASYILGIFWSYNFIKYRSLYAIWLSHAIIGSLFIFLISTINI